MFPANPSLGFISPPILLCETSEGSEFDWIKATNSPVNERQILVEPRTNCNRIFFHGKPFYICYKTAYQKSKKIQASEDHEIRYILPGSPRRSIFYDIVQKWNQSLSISKICIESALHIKCGPLESWTFGGVLL